MTDIQTAAKGAVLPAATPVEPLPEGDVVIKLVEVVGENDGIVAAEGEPPVVSEHQMVLVQYPDGYTKNHQVKTVDELAVKVCAIMRGRFTGAFEFTKIPGALEAGDTFVVKGQ